MPERNGRPLPGFVSTAGCGKFPISVWLVAQATIWDARDAQREKKLQAKLKRQAKQLGYELVPIEPQAA